MKIFIDTNIILDVFMNRRGLVEASRAILSLNKNNELGVSLLTFTTAHYIISKENNRKGTRDHLKSLRNLVTMVPTSENTLDLALVSDFNDFEDAVQYFTAVENGYELVCTRNVRDFRDPKIPVLTPEEILHRIENKI